jgi:hypothetical protein
MNIIHFIKYVALVVTSALILAPALALTASGERTLPGHSARLQLIEWQGGKPAADPDSDWEKGGGYGGGYSGKPDKQEDSKDNSGSGSDKSDKSDKNSKNDKDIFKGDECLRKFVAGSRQWKLCKGITSKDSGSSKPEDNFLTPEQCAAKFKKGSRKYLACIM